MPRIPTYEAQVRPTGPIQSRRVTAADVGGGGQGMAAAAQALSNLGQVVQRREEQAEISDVQAKLAEARAGFTTDLKERLRTAKPGDQEFSTKFGEDYDDYMQKAGENIQTGAARSYFERASASMRGQLMTSAMAGQAELAGIKAKQDYTTSLNNFTTVLNTDPSSFDDVRRQHQEALDEQVRAGGMSTAVAMQLKTEGERELAKSSVRGWIELDPAGAKEALKKGAWKDFVGGDLERQLFAEADQNIRAREVERERAELLQKKAREEGQKATQNKLLEAMTKGQLSVKDVLASDLDAFGSGSKEQFIQLMKASNKEKLQTDPSTFNGLFERIHLPDSDPKKIWDENDLNAYVGRGLTLESLNQLRGEMQGKKSEAGQIEGRMRKGVLDIAKGQLTKSNPMTGLRDPIGDEQMQKFTVYFNEQYKEQRQAGKTPAQLLSPDSPDYLGKHIRSFVRTQQQIMQDLTRPSGSAAMPLPQGAPTGADPAAPPAPAKSKTLPRQPGESAAAYLQRTGRG